MSYYPQPPRGPPPLPPGSRYPTQRDDTYVGDYVPLPPQQNQSQQVCQSSSSYSKKRSSGSHDYGGGRGGGNSTNNNHRGQNGGRGRYNSSFDRSNGGSYYGNGHQQDNNRPSGSTSNFNLRNSSQKAYFKPDMILDPWQQLARKLVPQGLLGPSELEIHFTPSMSEASSCTVDDVCVDDTGTEDDIETMRNALLDRV